MFSQKSMYLLPLAALAFPACAQQAAARQTEAQAQQGMVVVRDAETGELRAPTADEARALHPRTSAAAAGVTAPAPKMVTGPGGRRSVQLGDRQMVYSVVTRGAHGKLEQQCVHGGHAADAAVKGAHRHGDARQGEDRQ